MDALRKETLFTFDAARCRHVDPRWCKQQGFTPIRFFASMDEGGETIFLVVQRSVRYGDFALNKPALLYLAGRPVRGWVVLAERNLSPVLTVPVAEMVERLAQVPSLSGSLGEYYWLDDTGHPAAGLGETSAQTGGGYHPPF